MTRMEPLTQDEVDELAGLVEDRGWSTRDLAYWSGAFERQVVDALEGRPVYSWTGRRLMDGARAMASWESRRIRRPEPEPEVEPEEREPESLLGKLRGRGLHSDP
jgi:hypothetical protein